MTTIDIIVAAIFAGAGYALAQGLIAIVLTRLNIRAADRYNQRLMKQTHELQDKNRVAGAADADALLSSLVAEQTEERGPYL